MVEGGPDAAVVIGRIVVRVVVGKRAVVVGNRSVVVGVMSVIVFWEMEVEVSNSVSVNVFVNVFVNVPAPGGLHLATPAVSR